MRQEFILLYSIRRSYKCYVELQCIRIIILMKNTQDGMKNTNKP